MIEEKKLYGLKDVCIIPTPITTIESRSECNSRTENLCGMNDKPYFPLVSAPMSCVLYETNYTYFEYMGLQNKSLMIYDAFSSYRTEIYSVGATLFMVCMLIICFLYLLETKGWIRKDEKVCDKTSLYSKICYYIQFVPAVVYLMFGCGGFCDTQYSYL